MPDGSSVADTERLEKVRAAASPPPRRAPRRGAPAARPPRARGAAPAVEPALKNPARRCWRSSALAASTRRLRRAAAGCTSRWTGTRRTGAWWSAAGRRTCWDRRAAEGGHGALASARRRSRAGSGGLGRTAQAEHTYSSGVEAVKALRVVKPNDQARGPLATLRAAAGAQPEPGLNLGFFPRRRSTCPPSASSAPTARRSAPSRRAAEPCCSAGRLQLRGNARSRATAEAGALPAAGRRRGGADQLPGGPHG